MNMKKLMAGVAAGALAVTSLAAAASAIDLTVDSTTYQYNVEYTTTVDDKDAGTLAISIATNDGTTDGSNWWPGFVDFKVEVTYFDNSNAQKTWSDTQTGVWMWGTKSYEVKVSDTVGFEGITNKKTNTPMQVKVTALASCSEKPNKGDAVKGVTVKVENNTVAGKVVDDAKEVKSTGVPATGFSIGAMLKKADLRALADGKATLTFTLSGEPAANAVPTYLTVGLSGAADGAATVNQIVSFVGKTATIPLPANFTAVQGDEEWDYGAAIVSYALGGGEVKDGKIVDKDGNELKIAAIAVNAGSTPADTEDTSDTSDTQVSEDDPTNTSASDTQAPASSDDNGNTNAGTGDDKNQPTGVALAVIPAIVAAAGVVIAKKRG